MKQKMLTVMLVGLMTSSSAAARRAAELEEVGREPDRVADARERDGAGTLESEPATALRGRRSGEDECTPGYDPCIPPGPDVDCAGGRGNGPRYIDGPVYVTGSDPYDLDRDGDGVGCE